MTILLWIGVGILSLYGILAVIGILSGWYVMLDEWINGTSGQAGQEQSWMHRSDPAQPTL